MKILAVIALLPAVAVAAPILPTFDTTFSDAPGLSLGDAIASGHRPIVAPPADLFPSISSTGRLRAVERKIVSHMPVITAKDVDAKMPIAAPDSSTDFKLAVIEPKVESAH